MVMEKNFLHVFIAVAAVTILVQCKKKEETLTPIDTPKTYPAVQAAFGSNVDLNNLANYANQTIPSYITKDNSGGNVINNAKATLGRVLFYDKSLSFDNSVSCASCHQQKHAFGDPLVASNGVAGGTTGRHSMRLINARFSTELKFFWDERAATLEQQTTKPIQDHAEMGFSGQSGRPVLADLLTKLGGIGYYQELFKFVYGDQSVSEVRLQECLSQFIRSIQSFDSKFDAGRKTAQNDGTPFSNFTAEENDGKRLFLAPPTFDGSGSRTSGGLGCGGCHRAPEFDIDPNSRNNAIIGKFGGGIDLTNTKSPSLRDILAANGTPNSPFMHDGIFTTIQQVLNHYNVIPNQTNNTNLDPKLRPGGNLQKLNMTQSERDAVVAFLKTLTGVNVYTDKKWGNPFL